MVFAGWGEGRGREGEMEGERRGDYGGDFREYIWVAVFLTLTSIQRC